MHELRNASLKNLLIHLQFQGNRVMIIFCGNMFKLNKAKYYRIV